MANLLSRIGSALGLVKAAEGQYRPGPYNLPITGGWLPAGAPWNFWQCGIDPQGSTGTAMVEACVSAYSQTVAMCPGDHWKATEDGGRERVTTSALTRVLRKPNQYQSISDFLLNLTRGLYTTGNAYALALRNDRREIDSLHLMSPDQSSHAVGEGGEVFYALAGNSVIDELFAGQRLVVPARDVLHVKLHTKANDPLSGLTPLEAATLDVATTAAMSAQQLAFYRNQARPSTVLTTDQGLTAQQITTLREAWNNQAQGLAQGGTAILSHGIKPHPLNMSGQDAMIAEMLKLSDQHIALAFRVPLAILGIGGTTYASTELLMQSWIASGLGFTLNHVEEAFGLLFGLRGQPDEYLELNTQALLRSSFKERLEGLTRGVQGGIYSPNEARAELELPAAEFGDEPRVQQQVVPLSAASKIPATPGPAAPPAAPPAPKDGEGDQPGKVFDEELVAMVARDAARTVFRHAA